MAEETPRGYLVITAIEASGRNKDELYVWDTADFEGYVKSAWTRQLRSGQVLALASMPS